MARLDAGKDDGKALEAKELAALEYQLQSLQNAEKNYSEMQLDEMIVYAEILGSIANTLKRQRKPVEAAVRASEAALMAKKANRMLGECARKPRAPIRPRPLMVSVVCPGNAKADDAQEEVQQKEEAVKAAQEMLEVGSEATSESAQAEFQASLVESEDLLTESEKEASFQSFLEAKLAKAREELDEARQKQANVSASSWLPVPVDCVLL